MQKFFNVCSSLSIKVSDLIPLETSIDTVEASPRWILDVRYLQVVAIAYYYANIYQYLLNGAGHNQLALHRIAVAARQSLAKVANKINDANLSDSSQLRYSPIANVRV